jgi:hypothetical protein
MRHRVCSVMFCIVYGTGRKSTYSCIWQRLMVVGFENYDTTSIRTLFVKSGTIRTSQPQ